MKFLKRAEKIFLEAYKYEKEYKKHNDFARIATNILEDSSIHKYYNSGVINEIFAHKSFPKQHYGLKNFSDTPFTLFRGERFILDMYFWRVSDTDIHSHHFTGAFKMLSGVQHQLEFVFKKKKKLFQFLEEGEVKLRSSKELFSGDTQSIVLGDDFIHQTIHSDKIATVNLCLRTTTLPKLDLYSFLLSGYKVMNNPYNEMRLRKLSLIRTLPENQQLGTLAKYLETADLLTLINLFKGDQFAANYFREEFKDVTKECIKRRFSKDYQKLKKFLETTSNHPKLHKKLKILINE